jgi:hypothetical protein
LEAFSILKDATLQQRNEHTIGKDRTGVRWEALDEDIQNTLKQFPQINISALEKQIGIIEVSLPSIFMASKNRQKRGKKKLKLHCIRLEKGCWLCGVIKNLMNYTCLIISERAESKF